MTANEKSPRTETPSGGLSRRTLVKGVAWSLPVVAVAAAAPAYAASTCAGGGTQTFNPPASTDPASVAFVVPAGVTELQYTVAGGGGGSNSWSDSTAGSGGKVTGTLPVTPGETLTIFAAQGGQPGVWPEPTTGNGSNVICKGGRGYGNGGNASFKTTHPSGNYSSGGAGGGASAILRGSTPLIVAGGGGGVGTDKICFGNDGIHLLNGGDAGTTAPTITRWYTRSADFGPGATTYFYQEGGHGGDSDGRGGNLRKYTPSSEFWVGPSFAAGGNGTLAGGASGGNGGSSAETTTSYGENLADVIGVTGGGGGGGYRGGGAGETLGASLKETDVSQLSGNWDQNIYLAAYATSAGGGGGSSYLASGINGTIGLAGVRPSGGTVVDGYVILTWNC